MDDTQKIAFIKLRVGDVPSNPLHPMFPDTDYQMALDACGGDVNQAVQVMAISAAMVVSSFSTREVIDDFSVENSFGTNYLKALNLLITNPVNKIPANLMPWVATSDCDRIKLLDVADLSCCGQEKVRAAKLQSDCLDPCGC